MFKNTSNPYLQHYKKNAISPVKQNISNFSSHVLRRKFLYQNLGLTETSFLEKQVLEVGPGGGYNALAIAEWRPSQYTLIEPNEVGVQEIKKLFKQYQLLDRIDLHNISVEEFDLKSKFDVIICEGMLPGINNREEVLGKLATLLKPNCVLVITCADDISMFFEIMRRFFAEEITKNATSFEESVTLLVDNFGSHLKTLQGMTRPVIDWVQDSLMGEAILWHSFSIVAANKILGSQFTFYHMCSPNIINNWHWYKTYPLETKLYNKNLINDSYQENVHNLLHYQSHSSNRSPSENIQLIELAMNCTQLIKEHIINKKDFNITCLALERTCRLMHENIKNIDHILDSALRDLVNILERKSLDAIKDINQYPGFSTSFGRGQQYISFVKNMN